MGTLVGLGLCRIGQVGSDKRGAQSLSGKEVSRIGAVDYGKIPELKGVDLDQYRKASTTTTTIKIEKE